MSSLIRHIQPDLMRYDSDEKGGSTLVVNAIRKDTIQQISDSCKRTMEGFGSRADVAVLGARMAAQFGQRLDVAGGLALERELTKISTVVSTQPMTRLTSLSLIGMTPDNPLPGQLSYTATGMAQTGNRLSYSYTDKGGSASNSRSILATNIISPIIQTADYTINDMYGAALANIPLPALQMMTAKRLVEEEANSWNFYGDADRNITGLYTLPNVTPTAVANGGSGSPLWANKTPLEIFDDCMEIVQSIWDAIDGGDTNVRQQASILRPNRLAIAEASYFVLATTPMAANAALWGQSILQAVTAALRAVQPDFMIIATPEMNTGGGGSGRWMTAFADQPEVLGRVVALPGQFGVPEIHSFTTSIPYHTQVGGVQSRFPVAIRTRYGM